MAAFSQAAPEAGLFKDVRQVRSGTLLLYVVLHFILVHLTFSDVVHERLALPVFVATGGLVTYALLTYLFKLVLLAGGVMVVLGRLKAGDLGLARFHLVNAAVVTALLWALVQLTAALVGRLDGAAFSLNPSLAHTPKTVLLGRFLEATLGSALVEEISYRGFLLPQLFLLSAAWWPARPTRRLAFALAASQLYFGLNHLPAGLDLHLAPAALLLWIVHVVLVGVFFAALFLRTGNLFLAVGVHALVNNPAPLFASHVDPAVLALVFAVILLLLWPLLARPFDQVFTTRPALAVG